MMIMMVAGMEEEWGRNEKRMKPISFKIPVATLRLIRKEKKEKEKISSQREIFFLHRHLIKLWEPENLKPSLPPFVKVSLSISRVAKRGMKEDTFLKPSEAFQIRSRAKLARVQRVQRAHT